jgi:hypothetical protein
MLGYNEIFASEGATVTINCTVNSTEGLIWEYSVFSEKLIFKKIADGKSINPHTIKRLDIHTK